MCIYTTRTWRRSAYRLRRHPLNPLIRCAVAVQETIAGCNALAQLGASNSAHTKAFAEACGAVCSDCEKECRKHAAKHDACRKCADACQALVREVKQAA